MSVFDPLDIRFSLGLCRILFKHFRRNRLETWVVLLLDIPQTVYKARIESKR